MTGAGNHAPVRESAEVGEQNEAGSGGFGEEAIGYLAHWDDAMAILDFSGVTLSIPFVLRRMLT